MKILIADDEELIRFTIRDMVRETGVRVSGITEAANGRELITSFHRNQPDLILADIRMPGLSGLDAMEELKDEKALWIILTGHADFEYARQALKLGALDFLLKPPSVPELRETLQKAESVLMEDRRKEQRNLEHSLNHIISGTSAYEFEEVLQQKGFWSGWLLFLDNNLEEHQSLEIRNTLSRKIRERLVSSDANCSAVVSLEQGSLFVCSFNRKQKEEKGETSSIISEILTGREGLHALTISGDSDFRIFSRNWEICEQAGWQRFLEPSGNIQTIRKDIAAPLEDFCRKLDDWITLSSREKDETTLKALLQGSQHADEYASVKQNLREIFSASSDDSISTILKQSGKQITPEKDRPVLVDQALRIIHDRYNEEIGIAQIAYELDVTPNYLSSLFRKHTGKAFTRYMTQIRMERARILLKESSLNIREIASEVGYRSSRHFSSVFKQEEQLSPSEFIQKNRI